MQPLPALGPWATHSTVLILNSLIHEKGTLLRVICIVLNVGAGRTFSDDMVFTFKELILKHEAGRTQPTNRNDTVDGLSTSSPSSLPVPLFYSSKIVLCSLLPRVPGMYVPLSSSGVSFYFPFNLSTHSLYPQVGSASFMVKLS